MIKVTSIKNGSQGNLYTVQNEDTNVLLECGLKYKKIISKVYNATGMLVNDFDGCVVSHAHKDHSLSVVEISDILKVYCNSNVYDSNEDMVEYQIVNHKDNFKIGSIRFKSIEVNHGEMPCNAYIMKDNDSLKLFATDFSSIKVDLSPFKFDELWIECNYVNEKMIGKEDFKYQRQINTHMSATKLSIILNSMDLSKCKKINLIHLSKFEADKMIMTERLSRFNIPIEFAYGGNE